MKAHLVDTHLLVPRSSSSAKVKVKYQGHVSQKMGVSGAVVFHEYILFSFTIFTVYIFLCWVGGDFYSPLLVVISSEKGVLKTFIILIFIFLSQIYICIS